MVWLLDLADGFGEAVGLNLNCNTMRNKHVPDYSCGHMIQLCFILLNFLSELVGTHSFLDLCSYVT